MAKLKALYIRILEIVRDYWLVTIFILGLVILSFLVGYWSFGNWDWTGFFYYETITVTTEITGSNPPTSITTELHPGKTLWGILELAIIPLVIAIGVWWLNKQERAAELEIAADREQKDTLQAYLDKMTELMLEWRLRESQPEDEVRAVARARTLTALRELDGVRQGTLLRFLHEARLINKDKRVIDLREADLSGINLGGVVLLSGVSLERVILKEANLERAILEGADLSMAKLSGANLSGAILKGAILIGANLSIANLQKAILIEANLKAANLEEANLEGAILIKANLSPANLRRTKLRGTDLSGANLSFVNMEGAEVTDEQLSTVESLKEATLPDGTKHD